MQHHWWSSSLARRENRHKVLKISKHKCLVSLKHPQHVKVNLRIIQGLKCLEQSVSLLGILVHGKETHLKAKVTRHASIVTEFKAHLTTATKAWDTAFGVSMFSSSRSYLGKKLAVLLPMTTGYDLNLKGKYANYFSVSSTYFKPLLPLFNLKSSQLCQHLSELRLTSYYMVWNTKLLTRKTTQV